MLIAQPCSIAKAAACQFYSSETYCFWTLLVHATRAALAALLLSAPHAITHNGASVQWQNLCMLVMFKVFRMTKQCAEASTHQHRPCCMEARRPHKQPLDQPVRQHKDWLHFQHLQTYRRNLWLHSMHCARICMWQILMPLSAASHYTRTVATLHFEPCNQSKYFGVCTSNSASRLASHGSTSCQRTLLLASSWLASTLVRACRHNDSRAQSLGANPVQVLKSSTQVDQQWPTCFLVTRPSSTRPCTTFVNFVLSKGWNLR